VGQIECGPDRGGVAPFRGGVGLVAAGCLRLLDQIWGYVGCLDQALPPVLHFTSLQDSQSCKMCRMSVRCHIQQLDDCYQQRGMLGQVGGAVGQIGGRRFGPDRGWVLTIWERSWSVVTVVPGACAWWASCGI
jgi:hypothetical protein